MRLHIASARSFLAKARPSAEPGSASPAATGFAHRWPTKVSATSLSPALEDTAGALGEIAVLIDGADVGAKLTIVDGFSSAHYALSELRRSHSQIEIAASLANAEQLRLADDMGWVAWTLWSIKVELADAAKASPPGLDPLLVEANRLMMLVTHWTEARQTRH